MAHNVLPLELQLIVFEEFSGPIDLTWLENLNADSLRRNSDLNNLFLVFPRLRNYLSNKQNMRSSNRVGYYTRQTLFIYHMPYVDFPWACRLFSGPTDFRQNVGLIEVTFHTQVRFGVEFINMIRHCQQLTQVRIIVVGRWESRDFSHLGQVIHTINAHFLENVQRRYRLALSHPGIRLYRIPVISVVRDRGYFALIEGPNYVTQDRAWIDRYCS